MPIARKRFGQHFLFDDEIIAQIVDAIAIKDEDHLVEIGPGRGALTFPILKKTKKLDAIEIDRDLIAWWQKQNTNAKLKIHAGDALKINFDHLKNDAHLLKVFGNLPYNISTPLLFHLMKFTPFISDMIFMLQKEVAMRIVAKPNNKNYGRLSVMMQLHAQCNYLLDVHPSAFNPPPQVDSAVIKITPYADLKQRWQLKNQVHFAELVRHAFMMRRKTINNNLKKFMPADIWEQFPQFAKLRPENLRVEDYIALSNHVQP